MIAKKESFLINRIKSIGFAAIGLWYLIRTENSIKLQIGISLALQFAGFYYNITVIEWMFQTLAIGLVLSIEGFNTAIEKICDFVQPNYDHKIKVIKDIGAGAVFFATIASILIGIFIYIPKI